MADGPLIGGAAPITLSAPPPGDHPGIVEATVLPGRGMMLLQAVVAQPSGERVEVIHAPSLEAAAAQLDGGPEDFVGNASFRFGGAILAPFANRIRGRPLEGSREVEASIDGQPIRLPRNWGGREPGAETYAMHGLILASRVDVQQNEEGAVSGRLEGFGSAWPGRLDLTFEWRLQDGGLRLRLDARNVGSETTPFGAGWHPYFRLPSGDRRNARVTIPARLRTEVNNYDEVLPTGRLLKVAGTPYDFRRGRALGDLYLDDCFTGLPAGALEVQLLDPAARLGLRITAATPPVQAVQVYAPPGEAFVVIEPQFNLADPFGAQWSPGVETGMARLAPGETAHYNVELRPFAA